MEFSDTVINSEDASDFAELMSEVLERDSRRYFTDFAITEDEN